jgi:hypothetical protein
MSVYTKLNQARMILQKKELSKSGHNKFAGYRYFELGDFLPTVQEIFNNLGLCGVVSYTGDTASLTIVDTDDNSQIVITSPMGSAALKGCHEVQNIGAVETYQRRYLWVTAMEIVEHDAIDASEPVQSIDEYVKKIKTVKDPVELRKLFGQFYLTVQDNKMLRDKLTKVYNDQKELLNETSGQPA